MKRAIAQFRYQCGLCAHFTFGATRCDDKCENTVWLETRGPCGSVRRCSDDTVTRDTHVQGKCQKNRREIVMRRERLRDDSET